MSQLTEDHILKLYGGHEPRELPAYSTAEVAHHTGVPVSTVKSWVKGRHYPAGGGQKFFEPLIIPAEPDGSALSFVNLVEVHVLAAIRRKHKIVLPKVRTAIDRLIQSFNTKHPLADEQFATDGIDLFVERIERYLNVTSEQLSMREMLQMHLERIDRDPFGQAARLYPFVHQVHPPFDKSQFQQPRLVVIDPLVAFGRAVLTGTAIPTANIADRFYAGDSIGDLAKDYRRDTTHIEAAIRYELRDWQAL